MLLDFFTIGFLLSLLKLVITYSSNMAREVKRKCIPLSIALLNGRITYDQAGYFFHPVNYVSGGEVCVTLPNYSVTCNIGLTQIDLGGKEAFR